MIFDRLEDFRLSAEGIKLYNSKLKKSCYYPIEDIRKYQFDHLKKLLLICEDKVPYYQRLFKEVDFNVNRDFLSIDDLKKIPITTKKNVIEHKTEFVNPAYVNNSLLCKTSGSTGMPLGVYVSKNQWIIEQAVVWRQWKWAGYNFRDKMAIVRSYTPKNNALIKEEKARNFIYYSPYHLTEENMDKYLDHMISNEVKFLRGYPSSILTLAEYVIRSGHRTPKVKAIFLASEVLSDKARETIETAFGARAFNYYGLAECVVAMGDCEKHKGLHVFEEYGYVELLDTDDENIKKIIGTNLHNYAMPLLRYETNDLAEISIDRCECSRTSKVIKNVIGRQNTVIKLRDREIPLTNFFTFLEHYPEIKEWQIVQVSKEKIEMIIGSKTEKKIIDEIYEGLKMRLPEDIKVEISDEKEFVKKGEGKKLPFVSLL